MKAKTVKLIAAAMSVAVLGIAVGVNTYALGKNDNNDFGFKGTYSLEAFAAAEPTSVPVDGVNVAVTTTYSIASTDNNYKLFVTVVDVDDFKALTNVTVGYSAEEGVQQFNGKIEGRNNNGLTNLVYSSLTVKIDEFDSTEIIEATDLVGKFKSIDTPKFIIAEVSKDHYAFNNGATLVITGEKK